MSETTCASSAILPNLSSAAVDRKVAQLSPSVDRLFRGPQNTLTCDVISFLHLFSYLSYSLFSDVNRLRFHKSVHGRGMTHAICHRPVITEARFRSVANTWFFLVHKMTLEQIFVRALRLSLSVISAPTHQLSIVDGV